MARREEDSANWGGPRPGAGPRRRLMKIKIADLQELVANMQGLLNIAEVKAPNLRDDPQWVGLKEHHETVARTLGVEDWIEAKAEEIEKEGTNHD